MLASHGSREGVEQALSVLAGRPLDDREREQVIADTLAGVPDAKREWTDHGMIADVDPHLREFTSPIRIVVGDLDQVERPVALRAVFMPVLPQAIVVTIPNAGHLSPIECPGAIAAACRAIISG
jgi:pimeloyl-ACP methyl ester carboxylesterase